MMYLKRGLWNPPPFYGTKVARALNHIYLEVLTFRVEEFKNSQLQ